MNRIVYNIVMITLGWIFGGPYCALFMFISSFFFSFTDSDKKKKSRTGTFEDFFDFGEDPSHNNKTYGDGTRGYGYGREYGYSYPNTVLIEAYKTIGSNTNASDDEIRKAYRKVCLKHHPDQFSTASKEVQKQEEEKFKKVQDAYNIIKKERNIK